VANATHQLITRKAVETHKRLEKGRILLETEDNESAIVSERSYAMPVLPFHQTLRSVMHVKRTHMTPNRH